MNSPRQTCTINKEFPIPNSTTLIGSAYLILDTPPGVHEYEYEIFDRRKWEIIEKSDRYDNIQDVVKARDAALEAYGKDRLAKLPRYRKTN